MNGMLDHVWGKSPAADRVWAQVSGIAPSRSAKRPLMVLQAFCDESMSCNGYFVIAGFIATAEAWADFARKWEAALPLHGIEDRKAHQYHFKMNRMWNLKRDHVEPFYRIIEETAVMGVSCAISVRDFELAKKRIYLNHPAFKIGSLDVGDYGNIYIHAFRSLMDTFHIMRSNPQIASVIGNQPVDFYFDEKSEKKLIAKSWDLYVESRNEPERSFYGREPRFEDDRDFLPLQAADFLAWWVRKWHEMGDADTKVIFGEYCLFKRGRRIPGMHVQVIEDHIAELFQTVMLDRCRPGIQVSNVAFRPLVRGERHFIDFSQVQLG